MERSIKNAEGSSKIFCLNHDCLMHVFMFLPIADRLNVQSVCKQWYLVSQELWRTFKRLDVDKSKWQFPESENLKSIDITMFETILQGCGRYLTEINLTHLCTKADANNFIPDHYDIAFQLYKKGKIQESFEGLKALASNCSNIQKLSLCSIVINCNDSYLLDLFAANRKIRFINLMGYAITGACLFALPMESIETFLIQYCTKVLSINLCTVLERCQKLHTFSMSGTETENAITYGRVIKVVTSHIKSLEELHLGTVADETTPDYGDPIAFHGIVNLENLTAIQMNQICSDNFNQILDGIGRLCKNLKSVDLNGCFYVTDDILMRFTTLPKLEILCINHMHDITDQSLVYLSERLRILKCVACQITDSGVATILKKAPNIELLELSFCLNITNQCVDSAIDLTKCRTNNVVLDMYVEMTHIRQKLIKKKSPFLRLLHAPTNEDLEDLRAYFAFFAKGFVFHNRQLYEFKK